jgi:hypothetical protein
MKHKPIQKFCFIRVWLSEVPSVHITSDNPDSTVHRTLKTTTVILHCAMGLQVRRPKRLYRVGGQLSAYRPPWLRKSSTLQATGSGWTPTSRTWVWKLNLGAIWDGVIRKGIGRIDKCPYAIRTSCITATTVFATRVLSTFKITIKMIAVRQLSAKIYLLRYSHKSKTADPLDLTYSINCDPHSTYIRFPEDILY